MDKHVTLLVFSKEFAGLNYKFEIGNVDDKYTPRIVLDRIDNNVPVRIVLERICEVNGVIIYGEVSRSEQ